VEADFAPDPEFADCWFCPDVAATTADLHAMIPLLAERLERLTAVPPRGKTPPRGMRCRSCDLPLGDSTTCQTCDTGHCPFCRVGARCWMHEDGVFLVLEECAHLVAAPEDWGREWRVSPFDGSGLPCLPDETPKAEWSERDLLVAFGNLTDLLDAYDGDLTTQPDSQRLFAAWIESASAPVVAVGWTDGHHTCETGGADYYSPAQASFRRARDRLVRGLERGFDRLSKTRSRTGTHGTQISSMRRASDAN
jgi:hypothetical protein